MKIYEINHFCLFLILSQIHILYEILEFQIYLFKKES